MNPLKQLEDLAVRGMQPVGGLIWLGLDFVPPKRNALLINTSRLPTDQECNAVAGLDVVLLYQGFATKYGTLIRLCGSIYQARPRRLQIVDLNFHQIAFLKLGREL